MPDGGSRACLVFRGTIPRLASSKASSAGLASEPPNRLISSYDHEQQSNVTASDRCPNGPARRSADMDIPRHQRLMETLNVRKMRVRKSGNRQRLYQARGAALARGRGGDRLDIRGRPCARRSRQENTETAKSGVAGCCPQALAKRQSALRRGDIAASRFQT